MASEEQFLEQIRTLIKTGEKENAAIAFQLALGQGIPKETIVEDWQELVKLVKKRIGPITEWYEMFGLLDLSISYHKLYVLPDNIGLLRKLEQLSLYATKLNYLPNSILELANLKSLQLPKNDLAFLPKEIGILQNLETVDLSENVIEYLPDSFLGLKKIKSLNLASNRIRKLPKGLLSNLVDLESLNLGKTRLGSLEKIIDELTATKIETLHLRGNKLSVLPDNITELPHLKALYLRGNILSTKERERLGKLLPNCQIAY